jgi:carboxymethylenebutenolidase
MPVSWKGTLQQYAGRLHREHASKTDVRIIDFVDTGHPALLRMWDKRQRGYRAMGYRMVPVKDGEMVAYRAQPKTGSKAPVVLVVSEIFGAHEYIKDTCRRLAKQGYCAIGPELFARQGDPGKYSSIPDILANITNKTPDAQVMSDLDATVAWAAGQGADVNRLAITGFCWGGRITWLYCAHNPQVKAGVAWYGRLVGAASEMTPKHPVDVAASLMAPVLGLYGGLDTGIPLESIKAMEAALKTGSASAQISQIHVYDNAPARFPCRLSPKLSQGRG